MYIRGTCKIKKICEIPRNHQYDESTLQRTRMEEKKVNFADFVLSNKRYKDIKNKFLREYIVNLY